MSIIALGVLLATTLVAAVPIYLGSLHQMGLVNAVDSSPPTHLDLDVYTPYIPLQQSSLDQADSIVQRQIQRHLSGLAIDNTRYVKAPDFLLSLPGEEFTKAPELFDAHFLYLTDIENHVTMVAGRMGGKEVSRRDGQLLVEAVAAERIATHYGLRVGDVVTLGPSADAPTLISAQITGIIQPTDTGEQYWHDSAGAILYPIVAFIDEEEEDAPPVIPLVVSPEVLVKDIGGYYSGLLVTSMWFVYVEPEVIKESSVSHTLRRLDDFERDVVGAMPRSDVFTGSIPNLERFENRHFFSRLPVLLVAAMLVATIFYFLAMLASYLVERRQEELALLRSRGVGRLQLLRFYLLEGVPLTAVSVVVAPFLALAAIIVIGKFPFFQDFTGSQRIPADLNAMPFIGAMGAGLLSLLIILAPAVVGIRSGVVSQKRLAARPPSLFFFQRYFLDIGLLVLAGLVYWELDTRGSLVSTGLFGSRSVNETLLLGPVLFLLAVAAVVLRLFPLLMRLASGLLSRLTPAWATMALWRMSRNSLQYSWLLLLLIMVSGLSVLAATLGGTLNRSYKERILYENPTDIRIVGLLNYTSLSQADLKRSYTEIPGVSSASLAYRGTGRRGTSYYGTSFSVLALETHQTFPYITWYRDDFSSRSLSGVMRAMQAGPQLDFIEIPEGTESLGVWAKPGDKYENVFLWAVVEDAEGRVDTLTFGELGEPEWSYYQTELPSHVNPPLSLRAIQIFEPVFGSAGTPGTLRLDDLQVTFAHQEEAQVIESFESLRNWYPQATSTYSTDSIHLNNRDAMNGGTSLQFVWGKATDRGVRGFFRSPTGGPLPVVASPSFLEMTGKQAGDSLIVTVEKRFIPVVVRDTVDYFPTMNPRNRGGFLLADMGLLMQHINLLSPISKISPNEAFLATPPESGETVLAALKGQRIAQGQIHDRESELKLVRQDPLLTAGWRGIVLVSLVIVVLIASLGYITHMFYMSRSSRGHVGSLTAMGLSKGQLFGILFLEHLLLLALGLGLGTWAGIYMSDLTISAISHTEVGTPVIPPFLLVVEWQYLAVAYGVLVLVSSVALFTMFKSMSRLSLETVSRMEV